MWTQEKIRELKKLRAAGQSASQIAGALGVSRNAVLAMAWRLKLPVSTPSPSLRRAVTAMAWRLKLPVSTPSPSLRRAVTARNTRPTYSQLVAELRNDPKLLKELHDVLREHGYEQFAQIGEAADAFRDRFVAVWNAARQRRMAAAK
jgi:hypothetical protein